MIILNWQEIIKLQDIEQLRQALQTLDINQQDERGRTPLMLFITNRSSLDAIQLLLEQQPDLEIEDRLGHTALKKAIKFKQNAIITALIEAGAKLDSEQGILSTPWHFARQQHTGIADMLLDTVGSVRSVLLEEEEQQLDAIVYEEDMVVVCRRIEQLDSSVILHAVVHQYNWDDGPEPMLAVARHPLCLHITKLDMYELLEADEWLAKGGQELAENEEYQRWKELALLLDHERKGEHNG